MRQPIPVWWNTDGSHTVDPTQSDFTVDSSAVGRGYAYNDNVVQITCYDDDGNAVDLSDVTVWRAGYGTLGTGSALVSIADAAINQVADWASVDPSTGKLCSQLDLTDPAFLTYLGTASYRELYFELQGDRSDGLGWQTIVLWRLDGYNTVLHPVP